MMWTEAPYINSLPELKNLLQQKGRYVILKKQDASLLKGKCVIYKKVVISALRKSRPFIVKIERKGV